MSSASVSGPTYCEDAVARAECIMQQSKNVAKVTCWQILYETFAAASTFA